MMVISETLMEPTSAAVHMTVIRKMLMELMYAVVHIKAIRKIQTEAMLSEQKFSGCAQHAKNNLPRPPGGRSFRLRKKIFTIQTN
jgi:hypothetical protein